MKDMKKILSTFITLVLLVGLLAGCSSSSNKNEHAGSKEDSRKK